MYLQNAASLSRVEERRITFLDRRATIGRMGVRTPDADECSKLSKEEAEYSDTEDMPDLAKKSAAPPPSAEFPAPIVLSNIPE